MVDHRTCAVLLQFLVYLPHQALALLDIRFRRLPVEPLFEFAVAVVGVITLSAAGEVLVKRLVGVVEAVLLEIEAVRAKGRIYRDGVRDIVRRSRFR